MSDIKYIINGLNYTKDEILRDDNLKEEYFKLLKYNNHKEKVKNNMRTLRQDEKYKETNRIKINKRYSEDVEYRTKKLEQAKERRLKKAILENKTYRTGRGRPPKFTLNDNLEYVLLN